MSTIAPPSTCLRLHGHSGEEGLKNMSNVSTPRSRSRSKRSTTNLRDLRLAPLSTRFTERPEDKTSAQGPHHDDTDLSFARQHSSYIQGKSAPTTPGILSRSSSRKQLGGGLSRKGSIYDDDNDDADDEIPYTYAAPARRYAAERADMGSGRIPKAKSEAALLQQQRPNRLAGQGVPLSKRYRYQTGRRSGAATPRNEHTQRDEEDWLTHTGAMTSSLVQEGKGQTWLASRASSTSLAVPESEEDEDDDQYEEMAALSASTANLHLASFEGGSPVSTRVSRWGSRYGSRSASRRTSRLTSPVGTRTPRRGDATGYFDEGPVLPGAEPDFVAAQAKDEGYEDQVEVERLTSSSSFGLGNVVDRLMNFNLFTVEEGQTTTDDESGRADDESPDQARERMSAEAQRRRAEKQQLVSHPPPAPLGDAGDDQTAGGGWRDAAWLLSVASKAMF